MRPFLTLGLAAALLCPPAAAYVSVAATAAEAAAIDARPFPRDFTVQGTQFSVHQPQFEAWNGDRLSGRFAMSVKTGTHTGPDGRAEDTHDYGVIAFQARTQIDKGARAVVLSDIRLGPASFPTATAKQAEYLGLVQAQLGRGRTLTVSLDQLESALAIAAVDAQAESSQQVANDPPEIIFSTTAAVLILVDGEPALKPSGVPGVQRVINTRSLLLQRSGRYYTELAGHWASAASLAGPWQAESRVDGSLERAARQAVDDRQVDTMASPPQDALQDFSDGLPDIYVRTKPAELITTQGEPQFMAIPGTALSYIGNTGADVFIDGGSGHAWYALVSGRWFSAPGSRGPWTHVDARSLPPDFAKIPPDNPKSGVLASIPGTPEARESLIANAIPQTATVDRTQATLTVPYDGAPDFKPIAGTRLEYAWNTPVPVIRVAADSYYAVDKGVWFSARSATGPWAVATSVPTDIYSIPTSSPLHYVTYVRVYGSDGDEVYVGYTPGYYGTVVADDVVVYGTGYGCDPWIGAYWYGCAPTYGMGVYFGWNPWVGWTFGWGWGWYAGWYGPYSPWWGPWWGPAYPWGWWGGGAAAWNVYGHWGNAAVRGTAAAWANPWTGNIGRGGRGGYYNEATGGRGVGRAGINTNMYTGTTTAAAQGIRYNPQTGRVVAGEGAIASNPYTGRAAAAGDRTVVNTNTGRETSMAGGAARGDRGAAGAGGISTSGTRGDASAAGGFHYNADTGTLHHGGVADVNDNVYAGHDGNVYRYSDGQWQKMDGPRSQGGFDSGTLDRDRQARERGNQRIDGGFHGSGMSRPQGGFERPAGGYQRPVGGFRPSMGMRPMGGFRGRR